MYVGAGMKLVLGAPGSGKTTWVRERIQAGQIAVDVDLLFSALTMRPVYDKPAVSVGRVLDARDILIEELRPDYVISSDPTAKYRELMRAQYGAEVVVLETAADECKRRIEGDIRREGLADWPTLVDAWWANYERDERDEVIA